MVEFRTSLGTFTVRLYPDRAPVSTENFLAYVRDGFYDGTIFHRVVPGFVVQGGGFTSSMAQKPTRPSIDNEADNGVKNTRGTLAMARTAEVNSATSQFFINLAENAFLDHGARDFGYAVFGEVATGMDVVDAIAAVACGRQGGHDNVPVEPVIVHAAQEV